MIECREQKMSELINLEKADLINNLSSALLNNNVHKILENENYVLNDQSIKEVVNNMLSYQTCNCTLVTSKNIFDYKLDTTPLENSIKNLLIDGIYVLGKKYSFKD